MKEILKKIESFLETKSKREMILIFVLAFLCFFALTFMLIYDRAWNYFLTIKQTKLDLERQLLSLQEQPPIPKVYGDKELKSEIQKLEDSIVLQEKQKERLQGNFNHFLALNYLGKKYFLNTFVIQQEGEGFLLYGEGSFKEAFLFLEELENLQMLEIKGASIYPKKKNLEFFMNLEALYGILQ